MEQKPASQSSGCESDDSRTRSQMEPMKISEPINLDTDEEPEKQDASTQEEYEQNVDRELADLMTAEEYIEKNGQTMLEFEKQMFKDLCYSDGLVVCGK